MLCRRVWGSYYVCCLSVKHKARRDNTSDGVPEHAEKHTHAGSSGAQVASGPPAGAGASAKSPPAAVAVAMNVGGSSYVELTPDGYGNIDPDEAASVLFSVFFYYWGTTEI